MTATLTPPLKWHGGKQYLAERVISLMPPRQSAECLDGWCHYVEPFFGGGAVLLAQDPEGISEAVNDVNLDLMGFWSVLQNRPLFEEFHRIVSVTPFAEAEFLAAGDVLDGKAPDIPYAAATGLEDSRAALCVARACAFFVRCRQSLAGRTKAFAPLSRTRTRRGMNEQASAWLTAVEGLPAVHERLKRVAILGPKDALEVIRQQDGPRTLFYCDPPYLHETRATTDDYAHEMTPEQHHALGDCLRKCEGKVLLSGYPSALYQARLESFGWRRHDFDLPNNAAGGASKRRMIESVWTNY